MKLKKLMGFTLIELIASLAILSLIMASIFGVFSSVININSSGNNNYNSQSDAQLIMSKIQNEIKYADTLTIDTSKPQTFSSGTLYIYSLNGSAMKNAGVTESNSTNLITPSQGYTYSLNFKTSSSKYVDVTVIVSKNSKQLYKLETNVFINNLNTSNINGVAEGSAIEYTVSHEVIPVTSITVSSTSSSITTDKGTLQMNTAVLPSLAIDKSVIWSVSDTSIASISSSGLLTAIGNGTVTVIATAHDGSGIAGTLEIPISNQLTKATSITVSGAGSLNIGGAFQMSASVSPGNVSDNSVTWVSSASNIASISSSGLLTGISNGTVTVTAIANDGSGVASAQYTVTVTDISVILTANLSTNSSNQYTINKKGTCTLTITISPSDFTQSNVTWSGGTINNSVINGNIITAKYTAPNGNSTQNINGTVIINGISYPTNTITIKYN